VQYEWQIAAIKKQRYEKRRASAEKRMTSAKLKVIEDRNRRAAQSAADKDRAIRYAEYERTGPKPIRFSKGSGGFRFSMQEFMAKVRARLIASRKKPARAAKRKEMRKTRKEQIRQQVRQQQKKGAS
jgi:hypothetical protein